MAEGCSSGACSGNERAAGRQRWEPCRCSCSLRTFYFVVGKAEPDPQRRTLFLLPSLEGRWNETGWNQSISVENWNPSDDGFISGVSITENLKKLKCWVSKDQHFQQWAEEDMQTFCHLCYMLFLPWGGNLQQLQIMHTVYWFFFPPKYFQYVNNNYTCVAYCYRWLQRISSALINYNIPIGKPNSALVCNSIKISGAAFKPTRNLTQRCIMELIGYCSNYREREGERDEMGWLKTCSKSELGINLRILALITDFLLLSHKLRSMVGFS